MVKDSSLPYSHLRYSRWHYSAKPPRTLKSIFTFSHCCRVSRLCLSESPSASNLLALLTILGRLICSTQVIVLRPSVEASAQSYLCSRLPARPLSCSHSLVQSLARVSRRDDVSVQVNLCLMCRPFDTHVSKSQSIREESGKPSDWRP